MSRVQAAITSNSSSTTWFTWTKNHASNAFAIGLTWATWSYGIGRQIGWVIVTTGMITLLPLIFEIKRESVMDAQERELITQGLSEGKTPHELATGMGLTGAIEPKVLQ